MAQDQRNFPNLDEWMRYQEDISEPPNFHATTHVLTRSPYTDSMHCQQEFGPDNGESTSPLIANVSASYSTGHNAREDDVPRYPSQDTLRVSYQTPIILPGDPSLHHFPQGMMGSRTAARYYSGQIPDPFTLQYSVAGTCTTQRAHAARHLSTSTSSSAGSNASLASSTMSSMSMYKCKYSNKGCMSLFGREFEATRHEAGCKHNDNPQRYTCLLDTDPCESNCPDRCRGRGHARKFPDSRWDKLKEHMQEKHEWRDLQLPHITSWADVRKEEFQSWLRPYCKSQRGGFACKLCGVHLGTWQQDHHTIQNHEVTCGDTAMDGDWEEEGTWG